MRKTILTFILMVTFLALAGCLHWPREGTGGVAELYYSPFMPFKVYDPHNLTPTQALQMRLLTARNYLDYLEIKGAKACFPGLWLTIQNQANRTTRQFAGGLTLDAQNDLIILEAQVNNLKRRLEYTHRNGACLTIYRKPLRKHYPKVNRIRQTSKVYKK